MMQFAHRPHIAWGPLPSPRRRRNRCGLCGVKDPRLFHVPTNVWLFYVGEEQRHQIVCARCWGQLTDAVDGSAYERRHAAPGALWSPPP
jgi:hypothetical protein